jgi:tetratricopeptide (TPR) repeat protein
MADPWPFAAPPSGGPSIEVLIAQSLAAREAKQWEACANCAEQVLARQRHHELAWVLLCNALVQLGSLDADRALADALEALPAAAPARQILVVDRARVLAERGRWDEALAHVQQAQAFPNLTARQHDIIASVLAIVGQYEDGLTHAERACALGDHPLFHYNRATLLRYLGQAAQAEAAFEEALKRDGQMSLAYTSLASMRKWTHDTNHIARIKAALEIMPAQSHDAARLHHALFKEHDDLGEPERAWPHLVQGTQIISTIYTFDAAERNQRVDALIAHYSAAKLASPSPVSVGGPRPIFIFGLPRSGTTLTERVLASHSQVVALGETPAMLVALKKAAGLARSDQFEASQVPAMAQADFAAVARTYQACLAYRTAGAAIMTDKLPQNYEHAGPIHLAFPTASLVHVRRAPMDSLFGAHKLLFGEGGYHWSYRFEDLAANYRCYRRLMDHWRAAMGEVFFEITLEDLIAAPEREITRLLAHCGLPFEEACLSPHEAKGGVSTASASQIRRPINREGVGAWRRYEKQLEPLRAMLEADGFVDRQGDPIWA